jgi:hypothetical protein
MKSKFLVFSILAGVSFGFVGCNYEVPLTVKPSRHIDSRLLGDWVSLDHETAKTEHLRVRMLDNSTYLVSFDDGLYRAFHSDFANVAFLSVQDLNSKDRKYLYMIARITGEARQLDLQSVRTKTVPEETEGRANLQRLIRQNIHNPDLFGEVLSFKRAESNH